MRPNDPGRNYQSLSGGNQQKALVAKWMQTEPQLLLLHEPTQGVDVGAREQIFRMLSAAAEGGMSILCASSDYEQLAAICDRVLVLGNGRDRARAHRRGRRQGAHRRAGLQQRHARRGGVREDQRDGRVR